MKKTILVLTLLCAFTLSKAQQSFLFKIKYLPGCLYESTVTTGMNMEMNVSGDSTVMASIKAKGTKLPIIVNSESSTEFDAKTGAVRADNLFPIAIRFKNRTEKKTVNGVVSNESSNPLVGQTIFGHYSTGGKIQVDSISGKTLNDEVKEALATMIGNLLNEMHFPESPMKIGETFTQEVPFNLPLAGTSMEATIKIIYKLTSVDKNLAYFDLDESMNIDMSTEKNSVTINVKGAGKGSGKLIYDINNNYAPTRSAGLKMNYQMEMGKLNMTGSAQILSTTETKMSALTK